MPKPLPIQILRAIGFSGKASRKTIKEFTKFLEGDDSITLDWPDFDIPKELEKLKSALEKEDWDTAADTGLRIEEVLRYIDELAGPLADAKKAVQTKNGPAARAAVNRLISAFNNWDPRATRQSQASTTTDSTTDSTEERTTLASIESISPVTLKDMPDQEILSLHRRTHQLWEKHFAHTTKERAGKLVREDIWNAHQMIVEEMQRRNMHHESPLRSPQARIPLPNHITVVPQFISIVGSVAKQDPNPNDIDVLIRAERANGKFLIHADNIDIPIRKVLDPTKAGHLHLIANPQGPHAENIPLYDLVLRRIDGARLELAQHRRGIYLVPPHGELIHRGKKTAIVKSRRFNIANRELILVSGNKAYGIITFNDPQPITRAQFKLLRDQHRITEQERERWWPAKRRLWFYTIKTYKPFESPLSIQVPPGTQTFIQDVQLANDHPILIDLGCGLAKPDGYIGIDIKAPPDSQADIIYDLEQGIPLPDDYADEIRAHHVLEHLSKPVHIMFEIWRVLKPGGIADIIVPSTKGDGAFAHPGHKSFWNAASFYFYEQPHLTHEIGFEGAFDIQDLKEVTTANSPTVHTVETHAILRKATLSPTLATLAVSPWYNGPLPKPAMKFYTEFFSTEELWQKWAYKRIQDGIMVEEKLNGFRALLQKRGNEVRLTLSDTKRTNHITKFPEIAKAAQNISGDFIMDGDLAITQNGKRWPRPRLMTLLSTKPHLPKNATPIFTAFDLLYHNADLTDKPFELRRRALVDITRNTSIPVSKGRPVFNRQQLEHTAKEMAGQPMSEGIVAKELRSRYPLSPATSAWAKVKHAVEIKAIVLETKQTKSGVYNFRAGLLPGNSTYPNRKKLNNTTYIDLGFSFNAPFKANPGDIVTFQVEEIILQPNGDLAWLGAKPLDIDRDRKTPYTAPQVVDLARRGHILQDAREHGRKQMAITEELRRRLEQDAEHRIYAALQIQLTALEEHLPPPSAPPSTWHDFTANISITLAESLQPLTIAIATTLEEAARAGSSAAHADRQTDIEDLTHWAQITAFTFANAIMATTLKRISRYINDFNTDRNYPTLRQRIANLFSHNRARVIAETETTRGLAYGYAGTEVIHPQPPAHVDCRCYLASRPNEDGTYDIVWVTQNDELVCPICEPLHNRTVGVTRTPLAKTPANEGDTRGERAAKFWEEHWHESFPQDGQAEFVYHHHWRGLTEEQANWPEEQLLQTDHSVHGDLRLSFGAALWGFTCFLGTTKDAKARDLPNLPHNDAIEGNFKLHQPKAWLTIARQKPFIAEPGDIGSTTQKWSKFFEIDHGTYQVGVWHKHFFEIFLHGKKINGRYTIQFAKDPTGRRYWQIARPKDQTPFAEKHDRDQIISERKAKGDRWLIWAKPGQKPERIDLHKVKDE